MNQPYKIMLVAGEASGDQHAAELVAAIKRHAPHTSFFGMGGSLMQQAGVTIYYDLVAMAVIGIVEAVKKIGIFFKILKLAESLLENYQPDMVILTDFPDLNFKIAAKAKAMHIPVIYYISPQIWAWRKGRIHTIKRSVDHMLVIFPFEEPLYQQAGVPVTFVGHPLLDLIKPEMDPLKKRQLLLGERSGPLVTLAPGSRHQEIKLLLPIMAETAQQLQQDFPGIKFILPLARTISKKMVETILAPYNLNAVIIEKEPLAARAASDLAIISSGTATLETAILNVPMLICYKMHLLSYILAKMFVKLPYFGLANLAAGKKIAPEFLQHDMTAKNLVKAAHSLLSDDKMAQAQRQGWEKVKDRLGGTGAAERAAGVVLAHLRHDNR